MAETQNPSNTSLSCEPRWTMQWAKQQLIKRIGIEAAERVWGDRTERFEAATPAIQWEYAVSWFFSIRDKLGICDHAWQLRLAYHKPPRSLAALFHHMDDQTATTMAKKNTPTNKTTTQKKPRKRKKNEGQGMLL